MTSHIQLPATINSKKAIVCGDPARAKQIAQLLKNPLQIAQNREYHSYIGSYHEEDILVTSHGVGAAGAAICFQELINAGVKSIVRVGTAGGLQDDYKVGEIVVANAAVRKDGVSQQMIPLGFPAVADLSLTQSLASALSKESVDAKCGVVVTSDLFYPGLLDPELSLYQKAGVIAVEMECSALFVIGHLRSVATAAVLVLDGNPLKWSEGEYAPRSDEIKNNIIVASHAALKALQSQGEILK